MSKIILLLLIAAEDTDLSNVRLQKMFQNSIAERTGSTCNH